jgi:hypothetical protein
MRELVEILELDRNYNSVALNRREQHILLMWANIAKMTSTNIKSSQVSEICAKARPIFLRYPSITAAYLRAETVEAPFGILAVVSLPPPLVTLGNS